MLDKILKIIDGLDPGAIGSFGLASNLPAAVLSTTVIPLDGIYLVQEFFVSEGDLVGMPHYIGHEATKEFVEFLGAVAAPTKLFPGLTPGEWALCFPVRQDKLLRGEDGSLPNQKVSPADLVCRVIIRIS